MSKRARALSALVGAALLATALPVAANAKLKAGRSAVRWA
jgi:hypothetical protein